MQCVRFLADYINGDTYYKIKYPEHNLVRTKAQFKLLQSVEEHTPEMVAFINECLKKERYDESGMSGLYCLCSGM